MTFFQILQTAVNAILPIILLILLGYGLRQRGFLTEAFLKNGNRLTFRVLLPVTLFINVYNIESFAKINWPVVVYSVAMVCLIFLLGLVTLARATRVPQRKGVLLQCFFRSNFAIIGLPLAAALGSGEALAVTSVISAFTIPVFNILAVVALTIYTGDQGGKKHSLGGMLRSICSNYMILGTLLGLLALALRWVQMAYFGEVKLSLRRDLPFLYSALSQLKAVTTPFALLVLGGQFSFSALRGMAKEIAVGTLGRVVVAPLLGIGVAVLLSRYTDWVHFGVDEYPALIALFGSPTAVSSAIMAGEMGNDEQLATQLVVWTSLFSVVTVFVTVCLLLAAGLLRV
jgi:predicted permease